MSDETETGETPEDAAETAAPEAGADAAEEATSADASEESDATESAAAEGGAEASVELDELSGDTDQTAGAEADIDIGAGTAADLEPVFDVPVTVQAVLGKSHLEVSQLLKLGPGAIIELDRKVGEAIDIYVNDRLVARGEVVLIEEHLGVTMTEIIKGGTT